MNEAAAREVTLLQAFETAQPASPSWDEHDRAWATRLALDGDAPGFVTRRAHHAMQRLTVREAAAVGCLARPAWRWRWVAWAALIGALLGLAANSIGSSQRINLLAPPLWGVLVWNALVYGLLLGHAATHLLARPTRRGAAVRWVRPGALQRLVQRLMRCGRALPGPGAPSAAPGSSAAAWQAFASLWLQRSAPLASARASTLLHAGAAALAAGLIAGVYVRGLVLDYRAAWESTFLSAQTAHALLTAALAPAAALSGTALPDGAAFEALRTTHGGAAAGAGAGSIAGADSSAAVWIHLIALTLTGFVVLPRAMLAAAAVWRSHRLARHVALPLGDAYFERLARQQRGDVARVLVVPYASTPGAAALLALRALLVPALGDGTRFETAATLAFGAEDELDRLAPMPSGTTLSVAWFDFTATPEAESQGRFARLLAQRASTIVVIDEAAFRERFGAGSPRLVQRREAWRGFAQALGTRPVFVDPGGLAAPAAPAAPNASNASNASDALDALDAARALQLALRSPVQA